MSDVQPSKRQSWILDSTQWFADSRNWIPDPSFVELGFLIQNVSGIPDSLSWIPDSKSQDPGFHKQKSPWNPESGLSYTGASLFFLLQNIIGYVWRRFYVTGHIKMAFLLIAKTVSRSCRKDGIIDLIVKHCLVSFTWIVTLGYSVDELVQVENLIK